MRERTSQVFMPIKALSNYPLSFIYQREVWGFFMV